MKRWMIGVVAGGVALASGALAQGYGGMMRAGPRDHAGPGLGFMGQLSPEDVQAFTDARIAALRAGLKLSPEQDKLWPPVEDAIRALARQRQEQRQEQRQARRDGGPGLAADDLPGRLRMMADRQAARAEALRKLADAAAPLYATLDESQKRRLRVLVRAMRPHRAMAHGHMDRRP